MRIVGPFAAARQLDPATGILALTPPAVSTWQALDRVTGMPALVYLLPYAALPKLPDSPLLLPYTDKGTYADTGSRSQQAYVACDLPPTAEPCTDAEMVIHQGLRALLALHEAGVVHGAVSTAQFWQDGPDLLLSGAGLPWSEAPEPYRAPEGGRSAAADLYAFGITVQRLGQLPEELSSLLSPYPAQRPSARDALALLNAGPRQVDQRLPLMVDVPKERLPQEVVSVVEPLPLVADPDFRTPDIDLQETVLIPDSQSRLERQRREQNLPPRVVDLPPILPQAATAPQTESGRAHEVTEDTEPPAGSGPRVVRIKVTAQESELQEMPLLTERLAAALPAMRPTPDEPLLTPKLGLADAIPVRGRVTVRPSSPARPSLDKVLGEVLKPVKPSPIEPLPTKPLPTKSLPAQPIAPVAPSLAANLPSALAPATLGPAMSGLQAVIPPVEPLPQAAGAASDSQDEWVEEWSADGLVFSTLAEPPDFVPDDVDPDDVAALKGPEAAPVVEIAPTHTEEETCGALQEAASKSAVPECAGPEHTALGHAGLPADEIQVVEPHLPASQLKEQASEPPEATSLRPDEQTLAAQGAKGEPSSGAQGLGLGSRREFKPVKMAWNPDGSWHVKHETATYPDEATPLETAKTVVGDLAHTLAQTLSRGLRQGAKGLGSLAANLRARRHTEPSAVSAGQKQPLDTESDLLPSQERLPSPEHTGAAAPLAIEAQLPTAAPRPPRRGKRNSRQQAIDRLKPSLNRDRAATAAATGAAINSSYFAPPAEAQVEATEDISADILAVSDVEVAVNGNPTSEVISSESAHYEAAAQHLSAASTPLEVPSESQETPGLIVLSPETMSPEDDLPTGAGAVASEPFLDGYLSDNLAAQPSEVDAPLRGAAHPVEHPIEISAMPVVKVISRAEAESLPRLLDNLEDADIRPVIRTEETEAPERPRFSLPKLSPPPFAPTFGVATSPSAQHTSTSLAQRLPVWWWKALLALVVVALLVWGIVSLARRNAVVGGHITPPVTCCALQLQVYSPEGERLSVPVQVVAEQVPAGSKLSAGTVLGSAPGYINVDMAGHYTLGLRAESYQAAKVDVDLPRKTPLNITLQ